MHGSFSPVDVHNTLIAAGPRFKSAFADPLPSGNVDVAPTVAKILGFALPSAVGRVLDEALEGGKSINDYQVVSTSLAPRVSARGLTMILSTGAIDSGKTTYTMQLKAKELSWGGRSFRYFDSAKAIRR